MLTVTLLGILCCWDPLIADDSSVIAVGNGGATLFRMTLTVDLEEANILLLDDAVCKVSSTLGSP